MRVDFRAANPESLVEIYNGTVLRRYRIDATMLQQHTIDHPTLDWGASTIEPNEAFVAIKKSPASLYKGPNKDVAHLSILGFKDPTLMLDLLKDVKRLLIDRGVSKLQFGTDSGHFFPGCPEDCHTLREFLLIAGFQEGGDAHDLERDMRGYEIPCPVPDGGEFRPVRPEDVPALKEFLEREFPGRWTYDTFDKIRMEENPGLVVGLFIDGVCEGFALTQRAGDKYQIGGAVWREDLGENWCSLGPIGVSKRVRGKGFGNALLGKALEVIRDRGGHRCIIDWTSLVDFYGGHGFEVTRTYKMLSLDLDMFRSA